MCVATVEATETQGDKIRAIIRARRRSVQFMQAHPDEAADIIARVNRIDPMATRDLLHKLLAVKVDGRPYWNEGRIYWMASIAC